MEVEGEQEHEPTPTANTASQAPDSAEAQAKLAKLASRMRRAGARRGGGFITGFDIVAPDEEAKRLARIARFSKPPAGADGMLTDESAPNSLADAPPLGNSAQAKKEQESGIVQLAQIEQRRVTRARVKSDPLENRRDVGIGEVPRACVLHVFGVDALSTGEVRSHFLEYGPSWIEWINDSSCNVSFEDAFTASRAFQNVSLSAAVAEGDLAATKVSSKSKFSMSNGSSADGIDGISGPPDRMTDDDAGGLRAPVAPEDGAALPPDLQWRSAKPFLKDRNIIPLWMRMATGRDVRPERPNPHSKWARSIVRTVPEVSRGHTRRPRRDRSSSRDSFDSNSRALPTGPEARSFREDVSAGEHTATEVQTDVRRPGAHLRSRSGRLRARGGISKAKARKPTLMDVDRELQC